MWLRLVRKNFISLAIGYILIQTLVFLEVFIWRNLGPVLFVGKLQMWNGWEWKREGFKCGKGGKELNKVGELI